MDRWTDKDEYILDRGGGERLSLSSISQENGLPSFLIVKFVGDFWDDFVLQLYYGGIIALEKRQKSWF